MPMLTRDQKGTMNWIKIGVLFCLLSVALGAFGAHAMKGHYSDYELGVFETAVRYQFFHGLGILSVCALEKSFGLNLTLSLWGMMVGVIVFSGSLYALVFSGVRTFGAITPIGGVCLLLAWLKVLFVSSKN